MSAPTEQSPPTTLPEGIGITIEGVTIPERAAEFAQLAGAYLHSIGTVIDISRLTGVTASDDYPRALAAVERGFGTDNALTPSNSVDMIGIAMAAPVMREGVVKAHLVFDIESLLPLYLCDPTSPEHRRAAYMMAHECAHIEDLKLKDEACPGTLLRQREGSWIVNTLGPVGHSFWEEYYACRRSALFCPELTGHYEEIVLSCLDNTQAEADAAIRAYRGHHDLAQLCRETIEPATRTLKATSYLLGHLDGVDADWDAAPGVRDRLADHPLKPVVNDMSDELERLWSLRGKWQSYDEFWKMTAVVEDAWAVAGVDVEEIDDGSVRLHVPFMPWNS